MGEIRNTKGMGSFTENTNGTITYRKSVGYQDNGKRKVLCVTAPNKAVAIKKMREKEKTWEMQINDGKIGSLDTVTMLCTKHLNYQVEMGDLKPKSIDRREVTIANHIKPYPIGNIEVETLKVSDIEAHFKLLLSRQLSGSSVIKVVDVLNAAYKWACLRGEVSVNPVELIKPTLVKRLQKNEKKMGTDPDVEVLSHSEQEKFVAEALRKEKGKYVYEGGLYVVFLLYTGLRIGEFLALRWKDIDLNKGYVTIEKNRSMSRNRQEEGPSYVMVEGTTKNEKARKIKISDEAVLILKEIKKKNKTSSDENYICITRTGKTNTTTNVEKRNETIMRNAGLPYTGGLHILRRTFATNCYQKGGRTKQIAAYIGDLPSTTEKYYIAARKKVCIDGIEENVVLMPEQVISTGDTPTDKK